MKNTSMLNRQVENKWAEIKMLGGHVYYEQSEIDRLASLLIEIIDLEVIKELYLKSFGE